MWLRTACNVLIVVFLILACAVLFVLQSLYFIFRTTQSSEKEWTQTYLLEWTNPSLKEDADYVAMSQSYMEQGQTILFQYLPQNIRNQTINQMGYMCQSMINSCSYQEKLLAGSITRMYDRNVSMYDRMVESTIDICREDGQHWEGVFIQAYECCKNLLYRVPTTKGLCWAYHDRSMSQNSSSPLKQFSMTFQMSRNSWYSEQAVPMHPGVDVYLKESVDNIVSVVNELEVPIRLMDKKGVRLRMHKEKRADLRRSQCGQTFDEAASSDMDNFSRNHTNMLMCSVMVAIQYCGCHPLLAEMTPYAINKFRDFSFRINSTQVCTVDQYEGCARKYVDLTRPSAWIEPVPNDFAGSEEISRCRRENPYPCVTTAYPGTVEQYDLPLVYKSTQDFVARLVLEYSSTRVTEVLITKDPNLYELLSYIGYNLATWFAIGHIIWSLYSLIRDASCCSNKIAPKSPRRAFSISEPIEVQPADDGKESTDDAS